MDKALTTLPVAGGNSIMPPPEEWRTITSMAKHLFDSGFLPETIRTPQAALAIILKGRELGIPPMQAFASINVIKGKPTLSAELMAALVFRAGHSLRIVETTNERCIVEIQRKGHTFIYRQTFTTKDAQTAQLMNNANWQKYPAAMLRARCISAACRAECPDVIMGMYTPEELDESTPYTDVVPAGNYTIPIAAEPLQAVTLVDNDSVIVEPEQEQEREETARQIFEVKRPAATDNYPQAPINITQSPATEKQIKFIFATGSDTGRKPEQVKTLCREKFGREPDELTKAEASRFIEILKG